MVFDLTAELAARGEIPRHDGPHRIRKPRVERRQADSGELTREERLYLKAMRMRKPEYLTAPMPGAMRDVYEAALQRLHTSEERRLLQKAGMWDARRDVLYSAAVWDENDWADEDKITRALRAAGWRLAKAEAAQRALYEGVDAAVKTFTMGTVVVLGGGHVAGLFGERSTRTAQVEASAFEVNRTRIPEQEMLSSGESQLSTEDTAIISAAEHGRGIVNYYRYSAATPSGARDADSDESTNNRAGAVSSILAGSNILFNLGLFREGSDLAALGRDRLAGELTGKAQLESGMDPQALAVNASTVDRARGLFQFKPETAFALLCLHADKLAEVGGLLSPSVAQILENTRPRHGTCNVTYNSLSDRDKGFIRDSLTSEVNFSYGPVTGTRGAVLSTVLAGLLADELEVPADLSERYGLRVFDYISHQAGEGNANQIMRASEARDQHQPNSLEWRRADVRLKRTIFREVNIQSNMSVYADIKRLNDDRAARAKENQ